MTRLSVNLNRVAFLRNQRDIGYPNVMDHMDIVLEAGAEGITVHPRPDERHIRKTDVQDIGKFFETYPNKDIEFNIEGYPTDDFLQLCIDNFCHQVTLVPDAPDQSTSDHGWDFDLQAEILKPSIERLKNAGRRVSVFIDPDPEAPKKAQDLGADCVEIYTGPFAISFQEKDNFDPMFEQYIKTAQAARDTGIILNAGHDLNLDNLHLLIAAAPWIAEVSIGHGITDDALKLGWKGAIRAYLDSIATGQQQAKAA